MKKNVMRLEKMVEDVGNADHYSWIVDVVDVQRCHSKTNQSRQGARVWTKKLTPPKCQPYLYHDGKVDIEQVNERVMDSNNLGWSKH